MAQWVTMGATLRCSFGLAPSTLVVLPVNRTLGEGPPLANIMDHQPIVNIPPFGMCNAPANPAVIAATAAALGTPTPAPCVPATLAPWAPGAPTVMLAKAPALDSMSTCACAWGGAVTVAVAATTRTMVP
ncbi:MAG TPA: DUF4280 domain-containing protein [Burkholderiaceae bacterium]|nr:DUF4280 domain-containing protein [Burkholderiaceae bacterium]